MLLKSKLDISIIFKAVHPPKIKFISVTDDVLKFDTSINTNEAQP